MRYRYVGVLLVLLCSGPEPAPAADADGRFMVKGGGAAACDVFVESQKSKNDQFISFAGWVEGYLTYLNQREASTFDVAPWQSTELILAAVAGRCRRDPSASFHQAVYQVTADMRASRLQSRSELVTATVGEQSVVLYRAVVERIQTRLGQRGLFDGDPTGEFDAATAAALRAFQAERDLPATGLPDQLTLANLL